MTSDQLLVCGWVLTQEVTTPEAVGASLPSRLLTISDCIQPDLPRPDPWMGDWFLDRPLADRAAGGVDPPPRVVTVAIHPAEATRFVDECAREPSPWFDILRRGQPLDPTAGILGFEVVGAEETLDFHSCHCHGYADDVEETLGITVNDVGLLPSLEEARTVLEWMLSRPPAGAPKPVPWTVVALATT